MWIQPPAVRNISVEFLISLRNFSKNNLIRQGIKQAYKVALIHMDEKKITLTFCLLSLDEDGAVEQAMIRTKCFW